MCGPLDGGYGPYDYRGADPYKLGLVEGTHFTAPVEALVRGHSTTTAGPDLDYTLRAFPNHHRALLAVVRYGEKFKSTNPPGMRYPVECWFERALRFRRDDYIVRMIYASYLAKQDRLPDALEQLRITESEAKDNPFTYYNIGLVYFDLKQYDKALEQAHRAMALGFTRVELRDQLISVGKWQEAPPKKP
jgi:tetratricopeptide (TPR) repeat protein